MLKFQIKARIALWLICVLLASPVVAQQKRAEPPKKPVPPPVVDLPPTLDTLLSDDAYRVYFEVRNVGQVARSTAVTEMIGPLKQLMGSFDEIETMLKWTTEHADQLVGTRLFVAAAPTRKLLPEALVAVEFSSVEEAKKFQRQLRAFLPTVLPAPTPMASPSPRLSTEDRSPVPTPTPVPPRPTHAVTQEGPLVLVASRAVPLRDLKPRGAKLLVEDSNFNAIRSRFASEPLFLYINVASLMKEEREQREKWQEAERKQREQAVAEAVETPLPDAADSSANVVLVPADDVEVAGSLQSASPDPEATPATQPTLQGPAPAESVRQPTILELAEPLMSVVFTSVQPKWPDAVGAGLVLDDDAYTLRVLTINSDDSKAIVLPFMPQINSGPPITPASSSIFPAGTPLYLTLSLDYRELYSNVIKGLAVRAEQMRALRSQSPADAHGVPATEIALLEEYERDLGFKIKDDLLPVLGNEIALAMLKPPPVSQPTPATTATPQRNAPTNAPDPTSVAPDATPVVAIAIKDREAVKKLIGRVLEKSGLKGASLLAQTERREDTELTTYGNFAAYAFIGDFIVVSARAVLVRQVVDAYLSRQSLSSDTSFRQATQWQPRQLQGQLYVAPSLLDMYFPAKSSSPDRIQDSLARINSIDPLTYALTNDGVGPLHELRVPRNLLMFVIAGMKRDDGERSLQTNESIARSVMKTIASAEASFKETKGEGRYGTLDELVNEGLLSKDLVERYGYRIEVSALHNKFEATATPAEYGKTGRISFFIDDSGVLRAGDHGGGPATLADLPVDD